jgi:hypothetical protein
VISSGFAAGPAVADFVSFCGVGASGNAVELSADISPLVVLGVTLCAEQNCPVDIRRKVIRENSAPSFGRVTGIGKVRATIFRNPLLEAIIGRRFHERCG